MSNIEKIKQILKKELNLAHISEDASQANTPEWDSMAYMSIITRVEEVFSLRITHENIEFFSSFKDIAYVIEQANR